MTGLSRFLLLLLLLPLGAGAQPRVKAVLEPVTSDSFYRIFISPELTSWARADLSDLELRDSAGGAVPYLLDTLTNYSSFSLINYPLLSVRHDSLRSYIELSVPEEGTSRFFIQFAATAARRPASLLGSNDRRRWIAVSNGLSLMPEPRGPAGVASQELSFPYSRYRYLRLEIVNGQNAPLLPILAGRIAGGTAPTAWNDRQHFNFTQTDSATQSQVRIYNPKGVLLERLTIGVRRPAFFSRNVTVSVLRDNRWTPIAAQVLATGQGELMLPPIKDELIELRIENDANPPIQVDSVGGSQRRYYVVAHLEKGQSYFLYAGNPEIKPAEYDLSAFRDRIPTAPSELRYTLEQLGQPRAADAKSSGKPWIWIVLVIGIAALAFVALWMVKRVKAEDPGADT